MISAQKTDTQYITSSKVACDGDEESPHPRVFLAVGREGFVNCPYCGKHFVLEEGAHGAAEH